MGGVGVLRLGGGHDQRPDVGQNGQAPIGVEHPLQRAQHRMQCELRPAQGHGAIGSTPPRRAGEPVAAASVGGVPGASSAIESGAWLRTVV
jgi:hypothetical protein